MNPQYRSRGVKIAIAILAPVLLALLAQPLSAQSQTVNGTVVDTTGAFIPEAKILITDVAKGEVSRETNTDMAGRFKAIDIQPGKYIISVEKPGFKKAEVTITLDVNSKVDVGEIQLQVGQLSEVMSVNAEAAPAIQTNTMEKAYLVDQMQVADLPMNGRNFTSLMSTIPGMTSAAQSDFNVNFNDVSQFHSVGGRGSENNVYLDGSPNIDVGDNQSQYTQPSVDTIAEFRVLQSSFNAEYGRNSGMVIAVQTKAGGSSFHGAAYEYFRNNDLDAKCVLCNTLQPQLRYNQYGGNVSGWVPIPKLSTLHNKKIFFFYNREMTRRNLPGSSYTDVPNAQIVSGNYSQWLLNTNMQYAPQFKNGTIFEPGTVTRDGAGNITNGTPFPNNTIPASMFNASSYSLMKLYTGIPGYTSLAAAPNPGYVRYYWNNPDNLKKNQNLARIDYAISSKMNSFFRWVDDYQKETIQTGIWTGEQFPVQPQARPKPGSSWSWNLVSTFTPALASETILSFNHQTQSLSAVGTNPISRSALGAEWTQLYPNTNITNSVPDIYGAGPMNMGWGDPGWHNWGKDYGITENFTWLKGSHAFKFGAFLNRDDKAQTGTWGMEGSINFNGNASMALDSGNGLANLMLGNFASYNQPSAAIFPWFRFYEYDFFVQDSWKLSKRLTMEYGVRFAYVEPTRTIVRGGTPGGEGTFKLYSVDLRKYNAANAPTINTSTQLINGEPLPILSNLGLICDPCSGVDRGFSPAKFLPQPRVGFAYDLTGDGKTALRTGFGMFNERLRQNNFNFGAGGQWPNLTNYTLYNGAINTITTSGEQGVNTLIAPPNMTVWPTNNTMPTIYAWYAGIQRQLPWNLTLDVSYSGNHAVHLMDQRQVNALPAGYFQQNSNLLSSVNGDYAAVAPYLGWGNLTAIETNAYSRYDAMMLRVSRRFSNNIEAHFNYTYSKIKDIVDNDSDQINNPFNIRQNYGPAGYDQPNVVTLDFIYALPKLKDANPILKQAANGWQLSGMIRSQSGMPVTACSNGNLFGWNLGGTPCSGGQYPNLVGNPYAGNNSSQRLNQAAFQRPADGQIGDLGRNALRLPHISNVDVNVAKDFNFTETIKLTFRCEVFNLFNHPQAWGMNNTFAGDNPGSGISTTAATFGQINSWRDQRTIQLALRFAF